MNSPMGDFLLPEGFVGPRGLRALGRESSVAAELGRYLLRSRRERRTRASLPYAGHHHLRSVEPVLLVPGFMAGDYTLLGMARMLRESGYRTYRAHIRMNVGCTQEAGERLERRLESIAIRRNRKVSIVGHSLGGMLARGVAARRPDLVAGIVTLGSPVLAPGAAHRLLIRDVELLTRLTRAGFGGLMSADCTSGECARTSFEDLRAPLDEEVGFTAVYSKRDGIVDWRACVDPDAEAVEVTASHIGMAVDPRVFDVVRAALDAQRLSRAGRASRAAGQPEPEPLRPAAST